jgi:hypothetical protein
MARITTGPDPKRLAEAAYEVAELHRTAKLTRVAAVAELVRRCPGYTVAECAEAFAEGLFESR